MNVLFVVLLYVCLAHSPESVRSKLLPDQSQQSQQQGSTSNSTSQATLSPSEQASAAGDTPVTARSVTESKPVTENRPPVTAQRAVNSSTRRVTVEHVQNPMHADIDTEIHSSESGTKTTAATDAKPANVRFAARSSSTESVDHTKKASSTGTSAFNRVSSFTLGRSSSSNTGESNGGTHQHQHQSAATVIANSVAAHFRGMNVRRDHQRGPSNKAELAAKKVRACTLHYILPSIPPTYGSVIFDTRWCCKKFQQTSLRQSNIHCEMCRMV